VTVATAIFVGAILPVADWLFMERFKPFFERFGQTLPTWRATLWPRALALLPGTVLAALGELFDTEVWREVGVILCLGATTYGLYLLWRGQPGAR